jgi:hypothetical protein
MNKRFNQLAVALLLSFIIVTLISPFYVRADNGSDLYVPDENLYIPADNLYTPDQNIYKPSDPYQPPEMKGKESGQNTKPSGWEEYVNRILEPYDNKYRDPNLHNKVRTALNSVYLKYVITYKNGGHRLIPRYDGAGKLVGYYLTGKLDTKMQQLLSGLGKAKLFGQTIRVRSLPIKNQFNDFKAAFKFKTWKLGDWKFSGGGTWGLSALGGAITASLEGHEKWDDWAASFTVETLVGAATTAAGSAIGSALAGALASTAAGAALGSSVPIIGTAIGAVVGVGLYALTNTSWGRAAKNWVKSGVKHALNAIVTNEASKKIQGFYEDAKSFVGAGVNKVKNAVSSVKDKASNLLGKIF